MVRRDGFIILYIHTVNNRNQRCWLTRLRISAHNLNIERGRYTQPITPIQNRICQFCDKSCVDDEVHFLLHCETFDIKRQCLFGKMSSCRNDFLALSESKKVATLLCPSNAVMAKLVNKYISIMTAARSRLEKGGTLDLRSFADFSNDDDKDD